MVQGIKFLRVGHFSYLSRKPIIVLLLQTTRVRFGRLSLYMLRFLFFFPVEILLYADSREQIWQLRICQILFTFVLLACALYLFFRSEFGREKYGLHSAGAWRRILNLLTTSSCVQFFRLQKSSSGILLMVNPSRANAGSDQKQLSMSRELAKRVFDEIVATPHN